MKNILEENTDAFKDLIIRGLNKGAEAFSFLMKEPLLIKEPVFARDAYDSFLKTIPENEKVYVLVTELKGEIMGISLLIFTMAEAGMLAEASIGKGLNANSEKHQMMKDALLLETDNIITATVVTQYSELLGYQFFGGVPRLLKLSGDELKTLCSEYFSVNSELVFTSAFESGERKFSPHFLWGFIPGFLQAVKKYHDNILQNQ